MSQLKISEHVKQYASGAAQRAAGILKVANMIAPLVPVSGAYIKYTAYSLQNAFRVQDFRLSNGDARQLQTGGSEVFKELEAYGIDVPVTDHEVALATGANGADGIVMDKSDIAAQVGALSWANTVNQLAVAAAGAGTDLSVATSGIDLVDEIDQRIIDVRKATKCGDLCPVRIVIGPTAMRRLKNHTSVKSRYIGQQSKAGPKGDTGITSLTEGQAMSLFMGNPDFLISWITYDAADEGATESASFLIDDAVLIFSAADAPTTLDPSFMKTFHQRDKWMIPDSYIKENKRGKVLKFDWTALPVVTNSAAIKRVNITA